MSIMYHDGNRQLQDRFGSRRISDKLEEKLTRTAFTAEDKAFIEDVDPPEPAWKSFDVFKDCVHPRQPTWKG